MTFLVTNKETGELLDVIDQPIKTLNKKNSSQEIEEIEADPLLHVFDFEED